MNIRKSQAFFLSAVMVFMMTSCSKQEATEEETYNFGGAKTLSETREHFTQGKKITQDFYLTVNESNGDFATYTEFYRIDEKEVRLVSYDGYQTRFIRDLEQYVVVDDIEQTAALYPYENTHDDIMYSDMDFIISVIDMALSGELVSSDYSEETKDSFTEVYRIESDESLIFEFGEGKLIGMVFLDKSGNVIAVYEINYAQKGGKKSLFDYKDYKVTNMRVTEKTEETTTEE